MTKLDYDFLPIPRRAYEVMSPKEYTLFSVFVDLSYRFGDEDGYFFVSQTNLGVLSDLGRTAIRHARKGLEDKGFIEVIRYHDGLINEAYAQANDYKVNMEKVLEAIDNLCPLKEKIRVTKLGSQTSPSKGSKHPQGRVANIPKVGSQTSPLYIHKEKDHKDIDDTTKDVTSIGKTCPDETRLVEGKKERDEIPNENIESYGQDVLTNDGCDEPLIPCDDDGGNEVSEVLRANGMNDESEAKAERQQQKDITSTPRVDISGNGDSSKDILAQRREGEGVFPPTPTADAQRRIEEERATLMTSIERLKDDMYHAKTATQFQAFKDEAQRNLDRLMVITPPDFLQDFLTRYDRWYEKTSPYFICNQGTSVRKPTEGEYARLDGYGQGITYAHDMEETKRAFDSLCLYTDYLCREYSGAGTEIVDRMTGHMRLARNNNPNFVTLVDSE